MEKITSRDNARIKYACKLAASGAFRRSEGRFFAEGRKLCPELARAAQLETLFLTAAAAEKCPRLAALPGEHFLVEDHVAAKLAGVLSEGMLLCAEDAEGNLSLMTPEKEMPSGAEIC